jgi:hypothetical protein
MQRAFAPIALTAVVSVVIGCGAVRYRKDAGTGTDSGIGADGTPVMRWDFGNIKTLPDIGAQYDGLQPGPSAGHWVQAYEEHCPELCGWMGMVNVPSPEGSRCMSGEVRPESGVAANIDFLYGCYPPDCHAMPGPLYSASDWEFCYLPGQPIDDDWTDLTVGCFCR